MWDVKTKSQDKGIFIKDEEIISMANLNLSMRVRWKLKWIVLPCPPCSSFSSSQEIIPAPLFWSRIIIITIRYPLYVPLTGGDQLKVGWCGDTLSYSSI